MFEGLKKRLSNFMDSVVSKEKSEIKIQEAKVTPENAIPEVLTPENAISEQVMPEKVISSNTPYPEQFPEQEHKIQPVQEDKKTSAHHDSKHSIPEKESNLEKSPNQKISSAAEHVQIKRKEAEEKPKVTHQEKRPTVGTGTKLKGMIFNSVHLKETDIDPFINALKIGLLESDVNYDVVDKMADGIRKDMLSRSINAKSIDNEIRQMIRESIRAVLAKRSNIDLLEIAKAKRVSHELPLKILFIGPNGAGKTTTMAKMANLFITNGFTCVMSASDTFRAAAIEQTTFHADKLGIRVVKGEYGSDPASIAFDAIAHAKARNVDIVLMDSAGRQETNKSLIEELKKMARVTKPDMKIFIGEAIAGNSLLDQVRALNGAVGIDGIILTKLDCDAKGGNTLSLLSELDIPILFFGIGERYNDIMPYDPDFIIDNIISNN